MLKKNHRQFKQRQLLTHLRNKSTEHIFTAQSRKLQGALPFALTQVENPGFLLDMVHAADEAHWLLYKTFSKLTREYVDSSMDGIKLFANAASFVAWAELEHGTICSLASSHPVLISLQKHGAFKKANLQQYVYRHLPPFVEEDVFRRFARMGRLWYIDYTSKKWDREYNPAQDKIVLEFCRRILAIVGKVKPFSTYS